MAQSGEKKIAVFDVDGTLAEVRHLQDLLDPTVGGSKDWEGFYSQAGLAPVIAETVAAWHNLPADVERVVLTARSEARRVLTMFWLERNGLEFSRLLMRPVADPRRSHEAKRQMMAALLEEGEVVGAWEDDPGVMEVYRSQGVECHDTGTWNYQRASKVNDWHAATPKELHGHQDDAVVSMFEWKRKVG